MAKTKSAKKAHRVGKRRQVFNARRKRSMKTAVKKTARAIASKSIEAAGQSMPALYKAIDKAAKHGTIKKNTAARMKSRIAKRFAAISK